MIPSTHKGGEYKLSILEALLLNETLVGLNSTCKLYDASTPLVLVENVLLLYLSLYTVWESFTIHRKLIIEKGTVNLKYFYKILT